MFSSVYTHEAVCIFTQYTDVSKAACVCCSIWLPVVSWPLLLDSWIGSESQARLTRLTEDPIFKPYSVSPSSFSPEGVREGYHLGSCLGSPASLKNFSWLKEVYTEDMVRVKKSCLETLLPILPTNSPLLRLSPGIWVKVRSLRQDSSPWGLE